MKKPEIARKMARQSGGTQGEAADRLDQMVQEILGGLRQGKETRLPGLGRFRPGADGRLAFQREREKRRAYMLRCVRAGGAHRVARRRGWTDGRNRRPGYL